MSVGVWFTRIFLTMTSTIVATFFPYRHRLSAVCVLLTADETHNRTENQARNRNVLWPFFNLLSVHFSHVFQNMMFQLLNSRSNLMQYDSDEIRSGWGFGG